MINWQWLRVVFPSSSKGFLPEVREDRCLCCGFQSFNLNSWLKQRFAFLPFYLISSKFLIFVCGLTWHLLLLKNTWIITNKWFWLFVLFTCRAARASAKGRRPMRRWGIKTETKTWHEEISRNLLLLFLLGIVSRRKKQPFIVVLRFFGMQTKQKHQDWDDLSRAVDEVSHLAWDDFVQCVQIRGEPNGHN